MNLKDESRKLLDDLAWYDCDDQHILEHDSAVVRAFAERVWDAALEEAAIWADHWHNEGGAGIRALKIQKEKSE